MRFFHGFLLRGRDVRNQPILLTLLALAAIITALILVIVCILAVLASANAIRHGLLHIRSPGLESTPTPAGGERVAGEWFDKATSLLQSQQFEDAIRCLATARQLASQAPSSPTWQALQKLQQEHMAAARRTLSEGRIPEAYRAAAIAVATGDLPFDDKALVVACQALRGDETSLISTCQRPQEPTPNQDAFRRLVKLYAESIPLAKWDELPVDKVVDSFAKGKIDLAVPFRFTAEEMQSLAPLLKSGRRKTGEDAVFEFTGRDAKAVALRKVLVFLLSLTRRWFSTEELSRLLMVAAEALIHEPGNREINKVFPNVTLAQRRSLGLWTRNSVRSQVAPSRVPPGGSNQVSTPHEAPF
jgi:hypothetical protein